MKKSIAIISALVAGVSFASAQEDSVSVSASLTYESAYVFRGVELAPTGTFMPSVDVAYGDFYAGVWAAFAADSTNVPANEIDFYAGYGIGLNETLSLDLGATYYTYDGVPAATGETLEFYVGASFEVPAAPSIYVYYDIDVEALTLEGSVGHSFEVSEESAVELSAYLGYVDIDGAGNYYYYGVGAAYSYSISEAASISIFTNFYGNEFNTLDRFTDDNDITYGISVTAGF